MATNLKGLFKECVKFGHGISSKIPEVLGKVVNIQEYK